MYVFEVIWKKTSFILQHPHYTSSTHLSTLIVFRKKHAVPEDVEYFECQEQMNLDLYEEYQEVERVIGNSIAIRESFEGVIVVEWE